MVCVHSTGTTDECRDEEAEDRVERSIEAEDARVAEGPAPPRLRLRPPGLKTTLALAGAGLNKNPRWAEIVEFLLLFLLTEHFLAV